MEGVKSSDATFSRSKSLRFPFLIKMCDFNSKHFKLTSSFTSGLVGIIRNIGILQKVLFCPFYNRLFCIFIVIMQFSILSSCQNMELGNKDSILAKNNLGI